jgi:ABC-type transport system involved in cytochrome bd biosynthesis fused ATPase/permease subunit
LRQGSHKFTPSQTREDSYSKISSTHRNLSYTYPGGLEPTLKNISVKLEAGESLAMLAIVQVSKPIPTLQIPDP